MADKLTELVALLAALRDAGVSEYVCGDFCVRFAAPATQVVSSEAVTVSRQDDDSPQVGYKHPSLNLMSWPESKAGPFESR